MRHALLHPSDKHPDTQWRLLLPILAECEDATSPTPAPKPAPATAPAASTHDRHRLFIRRERTVDGWCLHFTGRDAHGSLIDEIIDEIERMFSPG